MAGWTNEQLDAANQYIQANIGDPGAIAQRRDELGLSNDDLLAAAQRTNPGISMGQVQQYLGETPQSTPQQQGYQPNPYLDQIAQGITLQANRNLNEQQLPGIRSQAIAAGGFGDARHGVAEGLAIGRTNDALTNSLASLYGTDYQKSMDRNAAMAQAEMQNKLGYAGLDTQRYGIDQNTGTQRYGIDQTYALGQTNAANNRYGTDKGYEVGMANANASMANAAASQANTAGQIALGQQRLGVDTTFGLLDRQTAYSNGAINNATNIQNAPAGYYQQFTNVGNSLGNGYNNTQRSGGGTDPLLGAAGMAQIGSSWLGNSNSNAGNNYQGSAGGVSGYPDLGRSTGGNGAWV